MKVLVADDNDENIYLINQILVSNGYEVISVSDGHSALNKIKEELPDIILLDVVMPKIDGFELTKVLKNSAEYKYIPIILITAKDSLDEISYGFECGANDYIKKPFDSKMLLARLKASIRTKQLYEEIVVTGLQNKSLRNELKKQSDFSTIISKSDKMALIFTMIERASCSSLPVLINGESGTGKELVAKAIHYNSARKDNPLVIQNCSALNENLLESELFGHLKGSFSGAIKDKLGLFQIADKGSFFLDEFGETSLSMQAKMLRVLQDGTFTALGDTKSKKVNVRIIAATNKNLLKLVQEESFREDLYYRINVINIVLPPLRERKEDIPILVEFFLDKISKRDNLILKKFSADSLELLSEFSWPGNIRQLENEIERSALMSGTSKIITREFLSESILYLHSEAKKNGTKNIISKSDKHIITSEILQHPQKQEIKMVENSSPEFSIYEMDSLPNAIEELEKKLISNALKKFSNNKSLASKSLGISRSNLITKVKTYGI